MFWPNLDPVFEVKSDPDPVFGPGVKIWLDADPVSTSRKEES